MSSILKVDQLQDSGGNEIITSNGSGTITVNNQTFKNGITMADQWRLTADITSNVNPISANLERVDNTGFGYIGSGMSVSSGTWTFPTTGIYLIIYGCDASSQTGDNIALNLNVTTNNSTYNVVGEAVCSGNNSINLGTQLFVFDVTDTSTHKVQFDAASIGASAAIRGNTDESKTTFTFIRLGDT